MSVVYCMCLGYRPNSTVLTGQYQSTQYTTKVNTYTIITRLRAKIQLQLTLNFSRPLRYLLL